jgi:hypothetical protein
MGKSERLHIELSTDAIVISAGGCVDVRFVMPLKPPATSI